MEKYNIKTKTKTGNKYNNAIKALLHFNKVWRAYRVMPTIMVGFCLYIIYSVTQGANMQNASWDLGAVLGGMGLLIERVLSAYTKTGSNSE